MKLPQIFATKPKPKIFICYRRSGEGAGFGGRIADKLVKHFGRHLCFRDIENIEKGTDFVTSIKDAINVCELLLVVIGPDWISLKDADGTIKIHDKNDFVRLELGGALARDIRVIPVLVGGAKVPSEDELPDDLKGLVRRQSHELTDKRWDYDSDQLIHAIESMGIMGRSPDARAARKRKRKMVGTVLVTILILLCLLLVRYTRFGNKPASFEGNSSINRITPAEKVITGEELNRDFKSDIIPVTKVSDKVKINYNKERGSIKNTITLGSNLDAEGLRTLNLEPMRQIFTGEALRNYKAIFAQQRSMGVYDINVLENQSFGDFNIYTEGDKLMAEVEVSETWSGHTHRINDNLCLLHKAALEMPQTVFLEKKNESWYIASIAHHNTEPQATTQCGRFD